MVVAKTNIPNQQKLRKRNKFQTQTNLQCFIILAFHLRGSSLLSVSPVCILSCPARLNEIQLPKPVPVRSRDSISWRTQLYVTSDAIKTSGTSIGHKFSRPWQKIAAFHWSFSWPLVRNQKRHWWQCQGKWLLWRHTVTKWPVRPGRHPGSFISAKSYRSATLWPTLQQRTQARNLDTDEKAMWKTIMPLESLVLGYCTKKQTSMCGMWDRQDR